MTPDIVIAGTLDTKSDEIGFVRRELERHGLAVIVIDCGILGRPGLDAAISREDVARAGGGDLGTLQRDRNREAAIPIMIRGLEVQLRGLVEAGRVRGYLGVGGGTNAALAAAAFRVLPFGVPKLLVSTIASGNTRPFVGMKDVVLMHSVVDVLGLSGFLRAVLCSAAAVMAALVSKAAPREVADDGRRCVAVTAFGSTTDAATYAYRTLTASSLEVLTFHARGVGGEAMEAFVRDGRVHAVLDLTTTEIADELVGGICSAGPDRLTAAAQRGIPQVVLPGAIDMVNFGPRATVPEKFAGRTFVSHTPHTTLMRTTPEENAAIGTFMADRLNEARGPAAVVIPMRGFSAYDHEDGPFFDPSADAAFREALTARLTARIQVQLVDAHINDPHCIDVATTMLLDMIRHSSEGSPP